MSVARFVVSVEPIKKRRLLRIQAERLRLLHKPVPALRVVVRTGGFDFVAPAPDFVRAALFASLIEPFSDLLVARAVLELSFEIGAFHPFEAEKHVIQRTIEMVLSDVTGNQRPTFVNGPPQDDITAYADPGAAGRLTR